MGFLLLSSWFLIVLVLQILFVQNLAADSLLKTHGLISKNRYVSAIGDPGMKSANVRVALEAWNFCNEVGFEAPGMGSPRLADCADLFCSSLITGKFFSPFCFYTFCYIFIILDYDYTIKFC